MGRKTVDISNRKFSLLTVVKRVEDNKKHSSRWLCECDCGHTTVVSYTNLVTSNTKSCGCFRIKTSKDKATIHDMSGTRFYSIYRAMLNRCNNKNQINYARYGGLNIKVCKRWEKFENFRDDMFEDYETHVKKYGECNTTLDRIKNSKGYCPSNCRYGTYKLQARNKRNNHLITFNGKTMTMMEWSEDCNINYGTLKCRINRYGWDISKALTTPVIRN